MAQYEHLPIYRQTMAFAVYIETIVRNFSRYYKYSLGSDLRDLAHQSVFLVIQANNQAERLTTLFQLRDLFEQLKIMMRLCKEVKAFNNSQSFIEGMTQIVNLSRQTEGWIKYINANNQN
ncbi:MULTISPECIES: four helix bundle protein [Cysteiniphilum]|uniref:four helix bundle protein n=1 Tax=Cysteiniphilum TaxID=2056696 RepID=UPI0017816988|nr:MULTISPECIES: four helix bundle protein [Cysteiniphilum]